MPDRTPSPAEYVAKVVDARGPWLWLVELGAERQLVASVLPSLQLEMSRLAPGDFVRIRFRTGSKSPRIVGYSDEDRAGHPVFRPDCPVAVRPHLS